MRAAAQRRREEQLRRKRRVDVRHVRRRTMAAVGRRRPLQNQLNGTHPSAPRVDAHERHNENPRGARVDARLALVRQGCDELARHKAIDMYMCVTCKISVFLP